MLKPFDDVDPNQWNGGTNGIGPIPSRLGRFVLITWIMIFASSGLRLEAQTDRKPVAAEEANRVWLQQNGVVPTREGIQSYFDELQPSAEMTESAIDLIESLSSRNYLVREDATERLKAMPSITNSLLDKIKVDVTESAEGEYRLNLIRQFKQTQNHARIQYAVCREIINQEFSGFTNSIVEAFPLLEQDHFVKLAAMDAMVATAVESDLEQLFIIIRDSNSGSSIRQAALMAVWRLRPESATKMATELSEKASGYFGLDVAEVLVLSERPLAFDVLKRLLSDEELNVRARATMAIRNITGLEIEFPTREKQYPLATTLAQINSWLTEQGTAIPFVWKDEKVEIGRWLIAQYDQDKVIELDASGKIVWSVDVPKPFACLGLPNGDRFIVLYQAGAILHYDGSGKLVKRIEEVPSNISGLCRRENGNLILATGQNNNQIVEIDSDGKQVAAFPVGEKPTSVEIANNGNLLVALFGSNKVIEIDPQGDVVEEIVVADKPYHATPLDSGNVLVTFATKGNKIIEYDRNGNVIWEKNCREYNYHAQELNDGTIAYVDSDGPRRIDRAGNVLQHFPITSGRINYSYRY